MTTVANQASLAATHVQTRSTAKNTEQRGDKGFAALLARNPQGQNPKGGPVRIDMKSTASPEPTAKTRAPDDAKTPEDAAPSAARRDADNDQTAAQPAANVQQPMEADTLVLLAALIGAPVPARTDKTAAAERQAEKPGREPPSTQVEATAASTSETPVLPNIDEMRPPTVAIDAEKRRDQPVSPSAFRVDVGTAMSPAATEPSRPASLIVPGEPARPSASTEETTLSRQDSAEAEDAPVVQAKAVVTQQNFPAPASPMPAPLQAAVANSLVVAAQAETATISSHQPAFATVANAPAAHVLKIELHPAELGSVTASMRFAGEQLSIEISVDNHEAYRRLSSNSDEIVKTMQRLGFEVDRVTVLQPQIAPTPASKADASQSSTASMQRDPGSGSASNQGGGSAGNGGQGSERNARHEAVPSHHATPSRRDAAGGGLVI